MQKQVEKYHKETQKKCVVLDNTIMKLGKFLMKIKCIVPGEPEEETQNLQVET